MWECMIIVAQKIASMTGFNVPAAKGATVKGMRAADINLQKANQPYPCILAGVVTSRMPNDSCHEWVTVEEPEPDHSLHHA